VAVLVAARALLEGRRGTGEVLGRAVDPSSRAKLLFVAGTLAQGQCDFEPARLMHEESLGLFRQLGDEEGTVYSLGSASIVAPGEKRHGEGFALVEERVNLGIELGDKRPPSVISGFAAATALASTNVALCLGGLAAVAASRGETTRTARPWGASEAMLETIEVTAYANTPDRILHRREVETAREKLDAGA
jgi:hypothetical protein